MGRLSLLTTLILLTFSNPAHAILEIRGMAGFALMNSESMNSRINDAGISTTNVVGVGGYDGIFRLPGTNLGLGARYDWQGVKMSAAGGSGNEFEISVKRVSALISYRFVDRLGYIGIVGLYGVTHTPWAYLKQSGTVTSYDSGQSSSLSGAFEGGMTVGFITFGAEIGFQSYLVRDLKGPSGQANFDINLGANYYLAILGIRF
jgi:hypothetical protein